MEDSLLKKYCENLNAKVAKNENFKIVGMDKEVRRMILTLLRKQKNNPLLIGEAGVGKTASVEKLAWCINQGAVPSRLKGKTIYSLEISSLLDSKKESLEFKMKQIIKELQEKQAFLFIDEVHTIVGVSSTDSYLDLGNSLKPAMARGEVSLIGATTLKEYHDTIEKDDALARRFDKILVNEPSESEAKDILKGMLEVYRNYYGIECSDQIADLCVEMSMKYIYDNHLPDKALEVLDQSFAYTQYKGQGDVSKSNVYFVVQEKTGIRMTELETDSDLKRLLNMENELSKNVKGQAEAISSIANAVRKKRVGLNTGDKPISFLFLGTTGVGKTEVAKELSRYMYHTEDAMIRFDMSEYGKDSLVKFIGDSNTDGILPEKVRNKPYSLILFDEIEKASSEIHNVLLQILDDGRLTDRYGRLINFKNTIIIMTTNIGAELIRDQDDIKDRNSLSIRERASFEKRVANELENKFSPEFLNRIDKKVVFNPLSKEVVTEIVELNLSRLEYKLLAKNYSLLYTYELIDYLADRGYDRNNGARPILRTISEQIEYPLSKIIINNLNKNKPALLQINVVGKARTNTDLFGTQELNFLLVEESKQVI